MKKLAFLTAISAAILTASASFAAQPMNSGDNKVVKGAKAVGRGVMWGPKKVGKGLKAMGKGAKKAVTGNK